jgi:hypothetical protein
VECAGKDSTELLNTNSIQSSSTLNSDFNSAMTENDNLIRKEVLNKLPTEVNITVESDSLTSLNTGLSIVGKALESYQPTLGKAAIITAFSVGGAKILKTLPASQRFVGMVALGGFTLASSLFNESVDPKQKTDEQRVNKKTVSSSSVLNTSNTDSVYPNDFHIDSPLENTNKYHIYLGFEYTYPEELLIVSILIITVVIFYMMLSIIMSYSIKLFQVESKEFVTKRPRLYKWVLFFNKGRDWNNFFLLNLVVIGFYQILYELIVLFTNNRFVLKSQALSKEKMEIGLSFDNTTFEVLK